MQEKRCLPAASIVTIRRLGQIWQYAFAAIVYIQVVSGTRTAVGAKPGIKRAVVYTALGQQYACRQAKDGQAIFHIVYSCFVTD
jgi:hypothetical protein